MAIKFEISNKTKNKLRRVIDMASKIVEFDKYCKNCKYFNKAEEEEPCCECLNNPVNEDSHKPLYFEEKKEDSPKN